MHWTWTGLRHAAILIFSSGCTSALLTYGLTKVDQNHLEEEQSTHNALEIASRLEFFTYQCSSLEGDYDDAQPRDRAKLTKQLPELLIPETGADWQGLSYGEQDAIHLLKVRMAVARDYIQSAISFASAADAAQAARDEAVLIGADAWRTAEILRHRRGVTFPVFPYQFGDQMLRDARDLLQRWRSRPADAGVDPG